MLPCLCSASSVAQHCKKGMNHVPESQHITTVNSSAKRQERPEEDASQQSKHAPRTCNLTFDCLDFNLTYSHIISARTVRLIDSSFEAPKSLRLEAAADEALRWRQVKFDRWQFRGAFQAGTL
ncbi:unnamed protein product [Symbiodinium natans]|uniref:Uncharacterized protein n=1 Tax=Symbiodinium natans TaxID=878477 RepID=A0A812VAB7_9DINO|nr:unnamed protein product [Symbiodinium natans]